LERIVLRVLHARLDLPLGRSRQLHLICAVVSELSR
jgi:hypothetical protein